MNKILRIIRAVSIVVGGAFLLIVALLYYQGRQQPVTNAEYVALGSSFAAGMGLGPRVPGSPIVCQRGTYSYPQQLADMTGLSLSDMTCSGATTRHVLGGGLIFLGPQIDAVGPQTRLVTLTAGGNDVGYVGDLTAMTYRRRGGSTGLLVDLFWNEAKPLAERDFEGLRRNLLATLRELRRRAPKAQIIVANYPAILPPDGACQKLDIKVRDAELMRQVAARLAEITREAALAAGAAVVDMDRVSAGHDACSSDPWVNGARPEHGAPLHLTRAGARAMAERIRSVLQEPQ